MENFIRTFFAYILFFAISLLILFFVSAVEILEVGLVSGIKFSIFGIVNKHLMLNFFLYRLPLTLLMSLFFTWGYLKINQLRGFFLWLLPLVIFFGLLFSAYNFFSVDKLTNPDSKFFNYVSASKSEVLLNKSLVAKRPVGAPTFLTKTETFSATINAHLLGAKGNGIWNLVALCFSLVVFGTIFALVATLTRWGILNFLLGLISFFFFFFCIKLCLGKILYLFNNYFELGNSSTYASAIVLFGSAAIIWVLLFPFLILKKGRSSDEK